VMNTGEIVGLAGGALCGGLMPMAWTHFFPDQNRYNGNLALQILVYAVLFIFTALAVSGSAKPEQKSVSLVSHIRDSLLLVAKTRTVFLLALGALVWGFCFNSIELYWQPRVRDILGGESSTWIFGLINGGYFLAALAGVGLINLVLTRGKKPLGLLLFISRLMTGALIILLSGQNTLAAFTLVYLLLFLFNGTSGVPEGTLINSLIPDDKRSSILSFSSLVMQSGGIIGALIFSALLGSIRVQGIWLLTGGVFALSAFLYLFIKAEKAPADQAKIRPQTE
jgi:DHA1 family quinolone resistance protein-like MFS transporter